MQHLVRSLAIMGAITAVAAPGRSADEMPRCPLISEVVTDVGSQFVEIYNPHHVPIPLDGHFLSNSPLYFGLTTQDDRVDFHSGLGADFNAGFPDEHSIGARKRIVVALNGSDTFRERFGVDPDFELYEDGDTADAIPDLTEAFPGSIPAEPGLLGGGDTLVLYRWDFLSDRVCDCDYVHWGLPLRVDKTGYTVDGIDDGVVGDAYADETPVWEQVPLALSAGGHGSGRTFHRREIEPLEGTEIQTGSHNGCPGPFAIDSHDETSEDLSRTWAIGCAPTPGLGPPVFAGCAESPEENLAVIDPGSPPPVFELLGLPDGLLRPKIVFRARVNPAAKSRGRLVSQRLTAKALEAGRVLPADRRWRRVLSLLGEYGIVDVSVEDRTGQSAPLMRLELGQRGFPALIDPTTELLANDPPPSFRFTIGAREKSSLQIAADAQFRTIVKTVRFKRGEAAYRPGQRAWDRLRAKLNQKGAHEMLHVRFISVDLAGRPASITHSFDYARISTPSRM